MNPIEIIYSKQLLVEGRDIEVFFKAIIRKLQLTEIQLQNFGGKNELKNFLPALISAPGFKTKVLSLGIIRDADENPSNAFKSVCSALAKASLAAPKKAEIFSSNDPRVGVFILPNSTRKGMLETICLDAVKNDPAMQCVNDYFDCLKGKGLVLNHIDKAKAQAFLSSRKEPGLLVGQAACKGYWNFDSTIFDSMKHFLSSL
jgi:hypothetical protein